MRFAYCTLRLSFGAAPHPSPLPALRGEGTRAVRRRSALPALHQLVVVDGLALGLLVVELGPRRTALAEPVGRVARRIEPRAAAAVGLGLLIGHLHAAHQLVHL